MGARPPQASDWDLDFDLDRFPRATLQSPDRRVAGHAGPLTRRGLPRAATATPPPNVIVGANEAPLQRAPPCRVPTMSAPPSRRATRPERTSSPSVPTHHGLFDGFDPHDEETLVVFTTSTSPHSPYYTPRRPSHADLNLLDARHDDPYQRSALIELSRRQASSLQPWLVFGACMSGVGVLVGLFFFG